MEHHSDLITKNWDFRIEKRRKLWEKWVTSRRASSECLFANGFEAESCHFAGKYTMRTKEFPIRKSSVGCRYSNGERHWAYPGQMALTLMQVSYRDEFNSGQRRTWYVEELVWPPVQMLGGSLSGSVNLRAWCMVHYWPAALLGWSRGNGILESQRNECMVVRTTPCPVSVGAKHSFTMWIKGCRWGDVDNTRGIEIGWTFCKKIWKAEANY